MSRRRILLIVLVALGAAAAALLMDRQVDPGVERIHLTVRGAGDVQLDGRLLLPASATREEPAPAVLLAHGLGDDQESMSRYARTLARAGYVVQTWSSRGTGASEGRVGIAAPDGEVADVSALIDALARRPEVQLDAQGDPRIGILGVSHGGGVAVLAAAADERIDAVIPVFAWHDLLQALEPGGVLKLRWASELFAASSTDTRTPDPCGALTRTACDAWIGTAESGALTQQARVLLAARSPSSISEQLRAPTLIVQGQMDSLFGLEQALGLAGALEQASVPTRVEWLRAGHDLALAGRTREHLDEAILRWFERYLQRRGGVETGPRFSVQLGAGRGFAHAPQIPPQTTPRTIPLVADNRQDAGPDGWIRLAVPPAGLPADSTTLPGLGDVTAVELGAAPPAGQRARFRSRPVRNGIELIGAPRITLEVTATHPDVQLYVRLVDVAPDGRRIVPRGLVSAQRLRSVPPLDAPRGTSVDLRLPYVAWRLAPGHRIGIEVSSTDAGFVAPKQPGIIAVRPATSSSGLELPVTPTPTRTADTFDAGVSWQQQLLLAALLVVVAISAGLLAARRVSRRDARIQEPSLRAVPVSVSGLTKRYGHRTVVDHAAFTVAPGSIVGLVGPNGAGKTTTLRMLLGLVHPDDGFVHVFGQRVRPGAPQLARIGALVEGPGLLPHVSGREHLRRHWTATGRPPGEAQAQVEQVLDAVGLTADAHRTVRTWSHGMRQRLGIAQALLGEPDLVLLDEPVNGLDPAQIIQLRELLRSIADSGRTVLLSSHLLGELERICTHVVLMVDGRVLQAGAINDVVGTHEHLEAAFLAYVAEAEHAR